MINWSPAWNSRYSPSGLDQAETGVRLDIRMFSGQGLGETLNAFFKRRPGSPHGPCSPLPTPTSTALDTAYRPRPHHRCRDPGGAAGRRRCHAEGRLRYHQLAGCSRRVLKNEVPLRDRCSFGRFPWLISQALSVTYMAGERRLYLERNCRLPESPAHSGGIARGLPVPRG